MPMDDDDDYLEGDTYRLLADLPFEMADRLPDDRRHVIGYDAAYAQWDQVVQTVAGVAVLQGVPITPEEKDLLVRGLRWVGEPHDLAEARVIDPLERAELAARWRFEPAPPAGDQVERFLVRYCRREAEAKALVTAWRHGPGGERQRIWCLVTASGADPGDVWVGAVSPLSIDVLEGDRLADAGVVLEAVAAGGQWPAYHRRLMQAAAPVWVAWGFRLGKVVAAQPQPLTLVRLGEGDDVVFPGPPATTRWTPWWRAGRRMPRACRRRCGPGLSPATRNKATSAPGPTAWWSTTRTRPAPPAGRAWRWSAGPPAGRWRWR